MNDNAHAAEPLDLEEHRQEIISEMVDEHGPNWTEQYAPGTFGCHELLDRTIQAAETVEQFVLSHPACAQTRSGSPWRSRQ